MNEVQLKQNIIRKLEDMGQQKLTFLDSLIGNLDRYLQSENTHLSPKNIDERQHQAFISSLRGKYAEAPTSSDEFAQRKQAEIDWEKRPK